VRQGGLISLVDDNLQASTTSEDEILMKISSRLDALNARDFAKADAIRADLLAQGIQLMDYKDPETGKRRTRWEVKR
jgi:cysteinyl-tRNA synthetase